MLPVQTTGWGLARISRNGHGAMSQELDPHAESSHQAVYSSSSSGPRVITAQSQDRGLTNTPDRETAMSGSSKKSASLPPRWFIRSFWVVQRAVYSVTRGRFGLRSATADHQGMMRLRTVGRRSGEERIAILAYFEDGQDLVTMAMNGWADAEPAWWLNLQARPDVTVDLPGGSRAVHGRAADKDERPRLWARWAAYDRDVDLDAFAARRSRETAVVILSPRPA
jgi:deazaflavin-dependent oxidoreductase (nitroreductase family)